MANKIRITDVPPTVAKGVTMTTEPRSIMDKIMGRSVTNYSRPVPTIKLDKQKTNTFKPLRGTGKNLGGKGWGP